MNLENVKDALHQIEKNLENVKDALHQAEMAEKLNQSQKSSYVSIERANMMRYVYSLFESGLNAWEVAEKIKDNFKNVWDAYYFVSSEKNQENIRMRYARAYLVKTLADSGFKYAEISPIVGLTPQRCGQIAHTFKKSGIMC